MLRHMVLNSIRSYRRRFTDEYGEMVIACDSTNYWRRQLFPYYKARRHEDRDRSELDWGEVFRCIDLLRAEIAEYLPYRVICVPTAEADDVIGTLAHEFGSILNTGERILILSRDKDFIQLQRYPNVRQYDPIGGRWIEHDDPVSYLNEHIIRGDFGDGIPNVLSDDDSIASRKRQRPITERRVSDILSGNYDETVGRNLDRNRRLIDLSMIPDDIRAEVLRQYDVGGGDRSRMLEYFMKYRLRNLMDVVTEF
jgi:hypothetical protein